MPHTPLRVESVLAGQDNIIWLIATGPGSYAAVDPGDADPVTHFLSSRQADLSHILLTHHHLDHIGGVETLRKRHASLVMGARNDASRLPRLDQAVVHGDTIELGVDIQLQIMAVPGHTTGHVVYYTADALFSGDTLFGFGCGRLFEGTPHMMWESLLQLKNLPDATRLFAGHEYTLANLKFVCDLEPERVEWGDLRREVMQLLDAGQLTLPHPLAKEKQFNPFLRADDPLFAARIGLAGKTPVEVFATLREMRNRY
ncbi:MAG: hydroxyacylglutathione hydrolase [Magnetococcus sp. YQC-5]